jgi:hypothetical protein
MAGGSYARPPKYIPRFCRIKTDLAAMRNEYIHGNTSIDDDVKIILFISFPKQNFPGFCFSDAPPVIFRCRVKALETMGFY